MYQNNENHCNENVANQCKLEDSNAQSNSSTGLILCQQKLRRIKIKHKNVFIFFLQRYYERNTFHFLNCKMFLRENLRFLIYQWIFHIAYMRIRSQNVKSADMIPKYLRRLQLCIFLLIIRKLLNNIKCRIKYSQTKNAMVNNDIKKILVKF